MLERGYKRTRKRETSNEADLGEESQNLLKFDMRKKEGSYEWLPVSDLSTEKDGVVINLYGKVMSKIDLRENHETVSVQFSSVAQSWPTLCNPMNRSTPGLPVHHQLPEFTQTHIHLVSDAIQPSHPLSSPPPPAPNPSQHQSLFQWVNSLHEVAKILEFQL